MGNYYKIKRTKMSYYGDVLDGTDKRMDLDFEKPLKCDAPKELSLKIKAAVCKDTGLSVSQDMVDGKFKVKNEMTKKMGEHAGKLTVTNKDYTYEHKWTPADLNKDGMKSTLVAEGKLMPAANDWEGKVEYKIGGLDLGGAQAWTELQLNSNKKKEHKLTYSQNMKMENYHLGWKMVYGVGAKKLT